MSFYSLRNAGGEVSPGRVNGDAMCGIIERVCIEVKKVYDACMQQERFENITLSVDKIKPKCPPPDRPLTFVSCKSVSAKGKIKDYRIQHLSNREHFARVQATVAIPIEVVFTDDDGDEYVGRGEICIHKDVIMYVPEDSIIPFELDNLVSAICVSGTYIGNNCFNITVCITVILKIVAEVNLLIPAYGFCRIPPCEEFSENVCDEFFGLPIFPPQLEDLD